MSWLSGLELEAQRYGPGPGRCTGTRVRRRGRSGLVIQVVVEHDDALVAAAAHVDISLGIDGDGMQESQLAGPRSATSGLFDEAAVLVVLDDARIDVAVGDEDVALARRTRRPLGDSRYRAEPDWPRHGGHEPVLGVPDRRPTTIVTRPAGLNLMIMLAPESIDPDVVLGIDADAMTQDVAEGVLANLPHVVPVPVELQNAGLLGAGVDVDSPLEFLETPMPSPIR